MLSTCWSCTLMLTEALQMHQRSVAAAGLQIYLNAASKIPKALGFAGDYTADGISLGRTTSWTTTRP